MSEDKERDRVETGRESGRAGSGVPHDGAVDTFGQADVGQGNWTERGPAHASPDDDRPSSEAHRPLGQGRESLSEGASDASDSAVHSDPRSPQRPVPIDEMPVNDDPGSGLSNYSRASQYGNQGRYGTPSQYNQEQTAGGELQNGHRPENSPHPGNSGPPNPNG